MWWLSLWEAHIVVSQKWIPFPTALTRSEQLFARRLWGHQGFFPVGQTSPSLVVSLELKNWGTCWSGNPLRLPLFGVGGSNLLVGAFLVFVSFASWLRVLVLVSIFVADFALFIGVLRFS